MLQRYFWQVAGVEAANKKQKDSTGSSAAVPQDDGIDSQIQQLINQHCMMIRVHEDVGAKVSNKKQKSAMKSTLDRISTTVLFAGMDDAKALCVWIQAVGYMQPLSNVIQYF